MSEEQRTDAMTSAVAGLARGSRQAGFVPLRVRGFFSGRCAGRYKWVPPNKRESQGLVRAIFGFQLGESPQGPEINAGQPMRVKYQVIGPPEALALTLKMVASSLLVYADVMIEMQEDGYERVRGSGEGAHCLRTIKHNQQVEIWAPWRAGTLPEDHVRNLFPITPDNPIREVEDD